ncbi:High mobility group [Cichlidogyrus casuarinus]|uniref:High mobility group n=1 Tax=Cichlidogyrus casuarinus TaxID=1844966 RepID=A0ABD2QCV2_9PLAT
MQVMIPQHPVKDKYKPKGPMSAYCCFVQVIREAHKRQYPGESVMFSDFSKICSERWRNMSEKEKQRFVDMATADKERYNKEMTDYIPPDGIPRGRKRKMPRDPGHPKRAWSAFFFFSNEFRPEIRAEHQDWSVAQVAKELGRRWDELKDKVKYEALAARDKERYEEDMRKYRAGCFVPSNQSKMDSLANHTGDASMTASGLSVPSTPGHEHESTSAENDVDAEDSTILDSTKADDEEADDDQDED